VLSLSVKRQAVRLSFQPPPDVRRRETAGI
jgi:hypothetical protein